MPVDAVAHGGRCPASGGSLTRLRCLDHLLVLDQLLQVTRCQSLYVVDDYVVRGLQGIDLDDPLHILVPAFIRLLLLYAIAQVVRSLFELELRGRLTFAVGRRD